jgi:uncharacterized protein YbjT (DUF2867 family)
MDIKVIITGVTGMVGEGVLFECLENPDVKQVLMVNRRPYNLKHPKLKELIAHDFNNLKEFEDQLKGYNSCFFCAGISSVGLKEPEYRFITYDITIHFAQTVSALNPDMVFTYVSGAMTDSSEKGKVMWARVKGKTENDLMKLPFKKVYNFRPGFMRATPGQKNIKSYYNLVGWLYPIVHLMLPNYVSTLQQVAKAMIYCVQNGYPKQILEIRDINSLAKV